MKMKSLLAMAALGLALGASAQAQTVIEITGATAFRAAAVNAINNAFVSGGAFAVSFNGSSFSGGNQQIWSGTFPGISGTTIIRTSWNGSVEGIRALAIGGAENASYLKTTTLGTAAVNPTPTSVSTVSNLETAQAEMAFSDVTPASTPVTTNFDGGPVGIVVFTMCANKTWRDDATTLGLPTSISGQQFRALAAGGFQKVSLFTGNTAHTNKVYLTGRNDGSGTRTVYLAETGFGIANPVQQYVVHDRSTATIDKILITPAGGGFNFQNTAMNSGSNDYRSTVWGNDQDGNGGYASGSSLAADLAKTSAAAAVWAFEDSDFSGTYEATEDAQQIAPAKLYLLTSVSVSDARTARGTAVTASANAQILGYNGVRLDDVETTSGSLTTLSTNDRAKVTNGQYTLWSYENLYYPAGNTQLAGVWTTIKADLTAAALGITGLPLTEMNVSRGTDGGTISPL